MADSKDDEQDDGMSTVADFVQIFMIQVDIIRANDLIKADTFGKSDPFVRVSAFSTKYETKVIQDDHNPVWNDNCEFTFFNDPKKIKFEVLDYDEGIGGKDDPLGDVVLDLDANIYDPENQGFSGKLKLQNVKKGELEVKVVARKLVPSELEQRLDTLQDTVKANNAKIEELDASIKDWTAKNEAEQAEIKNLNADITQKTAEVPNREKDLQDSQDEGAKLQANADGLNEEINGLNAQLAEHENEMKEVSKELEDVRIAEDKKRTENEHLRKDIEDLKKQIEQKKEEQRQREEEQRRTREAKEKADREKAEQDKKDSELAALNEKKHQEAEEAAKAEPAAAQKPTPSGGSDTDPLMNRGGQQKVDDQSRGCCVVL